MFISKKSFKALFIAGLITATSAFAASAVVQKLNYTDQLQSFYNPDRGFYTPQVIHFQSATVTNAKPYGNKFLHLRADISMFSDNSRWGSDASNPEHGTSQPLTDVMLSSFRNYLDSIRAQNKTVVVRFAYDPWYNGSWSKEPGKFEMEPGQDWVLKHIKQLAEVYNEYEDVITSVELGMFGPYGENHTSKLATPQNSGEALRELIRATNNVDLSARTAPVVARAFEFPTEGDNNYNVSFEIDHSVFKAKADSIGKDIWRVGLFNDGYLGTQYDYGTWGSVCATSICRQEGVAWLEKYGANVPYGGEALTTASGWKKINTVEFLSYEGFRTHTSYLNIEWNNNLIDEWKKKEFHPRDTIDKAYESYTDGEGTLQNTAFKYINDHLGYRYVLRQSSLMDSLGPGSLLQLNMKIQNVGFGNMTKKRIATILLKELNADGTPKESATPLEFKLSNDFDPQTILSRKVVLKSPFDNNGNIADYDNVKSETTFDGINDVKLETKLPDTLAEGKYAVYLRISQYGNWPADSNYSTVRFANDSLYYDKETGANYVGSFVLSKNAPVVTAIPAQRLAKTGRTIRLENHGQTLTITNAKRVEIFDLMGHRLMARDLAAQETAISLKNLPRTSLVIRTR